MQGFAQDGQIRHPLIAGFSKNNTSPSPYSRHGVFLMGLALLLFYGRRPGKRNMSGLNEGISAAFFDLPSERHIWWRGQLGTMTRHQA
jgi:hypothetical protein